AAPPAPAGNATHTDHARPARFREPPQLRPLAPTAALPATPPPAPGRAQPLRRADSCATLTGRPSRSTGPPNTTVTACSEPRSRPALPPSSSSTMGTLKPAL